MCLLEAGPFKHLPSSSQPGGLQFYKYIYKKSYSMKLRITKHTLGNFAVINIIAHNYEVTSVQYSYEQAISACERALCQLCVLSFRVEVKEEMDAKVVPCKWYSEAKY